MAPYKFVIEEVAEVLIGGDMRQPAWRVDIMKPDLQIDGHWFNGTLHNQHIPKVALEWRVAEYDMEAEEAIDLLIHEPFMNTALQLPDAEEDVKTITPMVTRQVVIEGVAVDQPIDLYNATTIQEAKETARARLSVVKRRLQIVSKNLTRRTIAGMPVEDPLDVIRITHNLSRSGVEEKKQFVTAMRQEHGLDSHLPKVELPERFGNPKPIKRPPKDEIYARRILEQKRDPEDHMWG